MQALVARVARPMLLYNPALKGAATRFSVEKSIGQEDGV
jgi:hypothetical protein